VSDEQVLGLVIGVVARLISDMIHERYPHWRNKRERESEISLRIRSLLDFNLPARRIAYSLMEALFIPNEIKEILASEIGYSKQKASDQSVWLKDSQSSAVFVYLSFVAAFETSLVPEGFSIREALYEREAAQKVATRFVDTLRWATAHGLVDLEQ
jgi:hypothetical protein